MALHIMLSMSMEGRIMRPQDELKNYLVCDLAAAKIERNLARLQAKRMMWATVALAILAAICTGISLALVWWIMHQPMKPLFFV